ncbi:hypothetical protein LEP1GSC050_3026 [Leptospira broomii serovar Hurstbridge str. 5399]|uniref:Uncharacterized protein n=1 Tax=Leptospira broomii serovar Hurstbridge str. 5399 TaxID=1049789 RepID=T0GBA5_9LEPT|nr:hypothetical protein LEP1GSC050_3026 [Leptospira broomii serovar Hurstbridge str. 5399]
MKITGKRAFLATILKSFLSHLNCINPQGFWLNLGRPYSNSRGLIFFFRSVISLLSFNTNFYFLRKGNRFQNRVLWVIGRFEL